MNSIKRKTTTFHALEEIKSYWSSLPSRERLTNNQDTYIADCLEVTLRSNTELADAIEFCKIWKKKEEEEYSGYLDRAIKILIEEYERRRIISPAYEALNKIYEYWNTKNVTYGVCSGKVAKMIFDKLHLSERSDVELQDIRDMAVILVEHLSSQKMDDYTQKKRWDCMSAITAIIDLEKFSRGMDI